MKIRLLILTIIFLVSCQIRKKDNKENRFNLTSKIDSIVKKYKFNGVISVSNNSTDIYSKAIGFSDLENKTKINISDQFIIGSISKQITAVLVLREYEKGEIALSDNIKKYLHEINQPWANEVTIHQLLTHTHGIEDIDKPLKFKQGTQFYYSQLGYEILAQILEKVTGKTFEKLSTELFNKYELNNSFHPNNKNYKQLVKGYEENQSGDLVFSENSLYNYAPAGSFISNAADLKKWNQKLYSGKLVKHETLKLMKTKFATRIHPIFETIEYGYGLLFKDGEQNTQIGALGYAPGFVSACYFYPQSNINLVILGNTARNLNDFNQTFKVHTEIMELLKKRTPNTVYNYY